MSGEGRSPVLARPDPRRQATRIDLRPVLLVVGYVLLVLAAAMVVLGLIMEQVQRTAIPKRFSIPIREIWDMQERLPRRHGKRADLLLENPRFRAGYDYDNLLYIVAGEVAAAAGGAPYETLIRRELFTPLGMQRCQVGDWRRSQVGNVAQPHMRQGETNVPVRADGDLVRASTMEAAGGIRCSLDDMLTWARMWLTPEATPFTPQEIDENFAYFETEDYRIGYDAFMHKKKPRFVGR